MSDKLSAFARAVRTFVQGVIATAGIAGLEALHTAVTNGTYDPRLLVMGVITAVTGAAVTYVFNIVAPRSGTPSLEGLVTAVRTLIQTGAAIGLVAAWDAAYALITAGNFSPADLGKAAVAAGVTSVVAYLHSLFGRTTVRPPQVAE